MALHRFLRDDIGHGVEGSAPTAPFVPEDMSGFHNQFLILLNELYRIEDEKAGIVIVSPVVGAGTKVLEGDVPLVSEDGVCTLGTSIRQDVEHIVSLAGIGGHDSPLPLVTIIGANDYSRLHLVSFRVLGFSL